MMTSFLLAAIVLLLAGVAVLVLLCSFYLSEYVQATNRSFREILERPHDRAVYSASRDLRQGLGARKRGWMRSSMFFDVEIPLADGSSAHADMVAVGPGGIAVVSVVGGAGELHGEAGSGECLVVPARGRQARESEYLIANPVETALAASGALASYLGLEGLTVPCVSLGRRMDGRLLLLPDGVKGLFTRRQRRRLGEMIGDGSSFAETGEYLADPLLSEDARRRACRALARCVPMPPEDGMLDGFGQGEPFARPAPVLWAKEKMAAARKEREAGDIVRRADKLIVDKENFDAFTWDKLNDIHRELSGSPDAARSAELLDEMSLLIRTNMSLNYRFGIAPAGEGALLSGAGLVVQGQAGEVPVERPSEQMRSALETTSFFGEEAVAADASAGDVGSEQPVDGALGCEAAKAVFSEGEPERFDQLMEECSVDADMAWEDSGGAADAQGDQQSGEEGEFEPPAEIGRTQEVEPQPDPRSEEPPSAELSLSALLRVLGDSPTD